MYYRYYRLWIYTCNAVLLLAVIVFCGFAGKILLADYKRSLVNGLNLTQPSFVYAYFALLIQSGTYVKNKNRRLLRRGQINSRDLPMDRRRHFKVNGL